MLSINAQCVIRNAQCPLYLINQTDGPQDFLMLGEEELEYRKERKDQYDDGDEPRSNLRFAEEFIRHPDGQSVAHVDEAERNGELVLFVAPGEE